MSRLERVRLRLQADYRRGLSLRVVELTRAVQELDTDAGAKELLRRLAHRLHGSGASYGLAAISTAAARLERAPPDQLATEAGALVEVLQRYAVSSAEDPIRVLLVEDDLDQAAAMVSMLAEAGCVVTHVADTATARSVVRSADARVDVVVLDLLLPDGDGRAFLSGFGRDGAPPVPVVVLSVVNSMQAQRECLALGADQFLDKRTSLELLPVVVAHTVERRRQWRHEGALDPLTGLPNRGAFEDAYVWLAATSARTGSALSLGMLDIDHFKRVNDLQGHDAGDRVIARLATLLTTELRTADVVGRWGGEEFAVLFAGATPAGAQRALESARDAFRSEGFEGVGGRFTGLTFSAGITLVSAHEDGALAAAVTRADRLLYRAKALGRDRVVLHVDASQVPQQPVLIVDDDVDIVRAVGALVAAGGMSWLQARTGEQALAILAQTPVAAVVLDESLPGQSGREVLAAIRADVRHVQTPVLMLSAIDDDDAIGAALDSGCNDYVVKPFGPVELTARLRKLLRAHGVTLR